MNWYKKSTNIHDNNIHNDSIFDNRRSFDWKIIFDELTRELHRRPTSGEVQQRLYDKYWNPEPTPQQMDLPFDEKGIQSQ